MRQAIALFSVVALLTAACGSDSPRLFPSPSSTPPPGPSSTVVPVSTSVAAGRGGITGRASIGPTCPVQRIDSPCPDRPFQGTIVARGLGGVEAGRTTSDSVGAFAMDLPAGTYVVTAVVTGPFPSSRPVEVTVLP